MAPLKITLIEKQKIPAHLQKEIDLVSNFLKITDNVNPERSLIYENDRLSLLDQKLGDLCIDFDVYSKKIIRGKNELIAKAIGDPKKFSRVLDVTLGLAEDAFFLLKVGYEVLGLEKSPLVYLLLKDAEARLRQPQKLQIFFMDSFSYLSGEMDPDWHNVQVRQGLSSVAVDTIYLDPMFENVDKKTALPRKEMQIFRKHIEAGPQVENQSQNLLNACLKYSAKRVVVKRPIKAQSLNENLTHSFKGKTIRYDLYVNLNNP